MANQMTIPGTEPIGEKPGVVIGGPLDPTAPEAQPGEKAAVAPGEPMSAIPGQETQKPTIFPPEMTQEPVYRGFVGDLKNVDELRGYTKTLEQKLTELTAKSLAQPNPIAPAAPAIPQVDPAVQKFTETVYSNPEAAATALLEEASRRAKSERDQEIVNQQRVTQFWSGFYERNPDLHKVKEQVELVRRANVEHVRTLQTEKEVEDFLSSEARKMVNLVKGQAGYTDTTVPSQGAVALGSTRTPAPTAPVQPAQAKNLSEQIRSIRPKPLTFRRA